MRKGWDEDKGEREREGGIREGGRKKGKFKWRRGGRGHRHGNEVGAILGNIAKKIPTYFVFMEQFQFHFSICEGRGSVLGFFVLLISSQCQFVLKYKH